MPFLALLLHSVPSICPDIYSVRCCTGVINPIADTMRELWKGRLQSTWQTLKSGALVSRSPFPFTLRLRKCCNLLRWQGAPKACTGRPSQRAARQPQGRQEAASGNILRCCCMFKTARLSPDLRTLKLPGNAMWVTHRPENDGAGLLGLEIRRGKQGHSS